MTKGNRSETLEHAQKPTAFMSLPPDLHQKRKRGGEEKEGICSVHKIQVVSIQNWHIKNDIAGPRVLLSVRIKAGVQCASLAYREPAPGAPIRGRPF